MSAKRKQTLAMIAVSVALWSASFAAFGDTLTPTQQAANKLQSDLEQALSESNFNALQRMPLKNDAAVLVSYANGRAMGQHPKKRPMHKAEKDLRNAFGSGLMEVDDAAQLNLDLANFQDSLKKQKKHKK